MNVKLPPILAELASSKKFTALAALIVLWTEPVRTSLGLDTYALKWLTMAFGAYFISQAFRDLGEELNDAAKTVSSGKADESTDTPDKA